MKGIGAMNTSTKSISYSSLAMSGEVSTCAGATTESNLGLYPEQVQIQIHHGCHRQGDGKWAIKFRTQCEAAPLGAKGSNYEI